MSDKYTERDDLPVDNPGVEPHVERYTDANPKAGNRAYRQVLTSSAWSQSSLLPSSSCTSRSRVTRPSKSVRCT
ncbi:ubiquinol-cytochrome C reductase iron-sulfur subunit [Cutibacterium acnes JCM 18918]|nr:ubiquinol-cytochrome C reductase iron-sulfur subunit [Cutibacterium acnes JCM 18918]